VREVSRKIVVCLLAMSAMAIGHTARLHAQTADTPETKRKAKYMEKPVYPELARKLNLTGIVKVEVTIGADGKVKRTHVVGGHPVLASEAERAAMQSEFEPGPKETTEVIEFKFTP
jgi:TonB family protein